MDLSTLLTGRNGLFTVAIFAITQTLKSLFPAFFATKFGQRLLPAIPLVLGVVGGLLGIPEGVTRMRDGVIVGIVAAFVAANLFKIGRTTALGWGLDPTPAAPAPADPPTPASTDGPAPVDSTKAPTP